MTRSAGRRGCGWRRSRRPPKYEYERDNGPLPISGPASRAAATHSRRPATGTTDHEFRHQQLHHFSPPPHTHLHRKQSDVNHNENEHTQLLPTCMVASSMSRPMLECGASLYHQPSSRREDNAPDEKTMLECPCPSNRPPYSAAMHVVHGRRPHAMRQCSSTSD